MSKLKWTYDACFDLAKTCTTKIEMKRKSNNAYTTARIKGWLNDYIWFKQIAKPKGYWNNYDNCYNEAKKYKSKSEFQKNCHGAYVKSKKNGWFNDYTWFKEREIDENTFYDVYCYFDEDTNAVYVGITINMKRRHKEHAKGKLYRGKYHYDSVYKYFNLIGKSVPDPIVLQTKLSTNDAQKYEKKYVEKFKNEGKFIINIAKTGSLGAYSKWTKEKCFSEAQKYKSRGEFCKNNKVAYDSALKNGWLDDYTWFELMKKPNGYWNDYNKCLEEAKKYIFMEDFKRKSSSAYNSSYRNGWLCLYTWFKPKRRHNMFWDYEHCCEYAKKCRNITEFMKIYGGGYKSCQRNGWVKKLEKEIFQQ